MEYETPFGNFKTDEPLNFSDIDKKVRYINEHRKEYDQTFRELNARIDLDFVKSSEMLEGYTMEELKKVNFSNYVRVLRTVPEFIPNPTEEEKQYLKENTSLVVMYKDSDGEIKFFVCKVPNHLNALDFALEKARMDHDAFLKGKENKFDQHIIEEVNRKLFENTDKNGVPGYGEFRHSVYAYGQWYKSNVRIQGDPWIPPDCDEVGWRMQKLVEDYNNCSLHPIIKAVVFKAEFIKIHPFRDGNGRTSRIILNNMLVRYGYPTVTIRGGEKKAYISAMNNAVLKNDYTDLFNIIKKQLERRCDKYIRVIREQKRLKKIDEQLQKTQEKELKKFNKQKDKNSVLSKEKTQKNRLL